MHALVEFLQKWSPHIWLFGSLFGVALSGALFRRSIRALDKLEGAPIVDDRTLRYWRRHSTRFLVLHVSYAVVGLITVAGIRSDWASLLVLVILLATPLVLVHASYDSLRFAGGGPHDR